MNKIKSVKAREIKDSRGNSTVEVELTTDKGSFTASCPSGASTGENEAVALPADQAIINVNEIIAPALIGKNSVNQKELDSLMTELDGTEDKSKLGANAVLPASMAICRAGATSRKISLYYYIADMAGLRIQNSGFKMPMPSFNIINGGSHAKNELELQEFMVIPRKKIFVDNLKIGSDIFNKLTEILKQQGGLPEMGDEGGYAPQISRAEQALFLIKNAIGSQREVGIAIDCAASEFYRDGKYEVEREKYLSRSELVEFYKDLVSRFPIISIEDPFAEEDWEGFKDLRQEIPGIIIIADDLTTTNIKRIKEAESRNAANGIIIKPNQIGTVSETIDAVNLAKSYGWKIMVSHRSGETMDNFIADLAVGVGADFIKSGAYTKDVRMVKYDRLLEIERELKGK